MTGIADLGVILDATGITAGTPTSAAVFTHDCDAFEAARVDVCGIERAGMRHRGVRRCVSQSTDERASGWDGCMSPS